MVTPLIHYNHMGAFNEGMDRGRSRGIAQLMGQAYQAPPEQRQSLLAKLAGVDGQAAMQTEKGLNALDDDVHAQLAKRAKFVVAAWKSNPQMAQQAYQSMLPLVQRAGLGSPPPQLDESAIPGLTQLASALDQQSTPSGYREFELFANAGGLQGDDRQKAARVALGLEGRAASGGMSFDMIKGADGVERPSRRNPRDGSVEVFDGQQWVPLGGQAPQGKPQINIDPAMFAGLEPSSQQALLQQILADANGQPVSNAGALAVGRRPEDEAAAKVEAEERARLGLLPLRGKLEAENEAAKTTAKGDAERDLERKKNEPKLRMALMSAKAKTVRLDDAITRSAEKANGLTTGWGSLLQAVPGTQAHDLSKLLNTVKANIGFDRLQEMRDSSPTGGALGSVTERELEFLQSVYASLEQSQSRDQFLENLEIVRQATKESWARVEAAYQQTYGQSQSGQKRLRFNPATGELE